MNVLFTRIKVWTAWLRCTYKNNRKRFWLGGLAFIFLGFFIGQVAPPIDFPSGTYIHISKGVTARTIADRLAQAHVINSPVSFVVLTHLIDAQESIKSGTYHLEAPMSLFSVVRMLRNGAQSIPVRVTFPEGMTVREMAPLISKAIPNITQKTFIQAATPYEGYLFPDTYDFSPTETATQVVAQMRKNFDMHIASITPYITSSGHSQKDIITMASIVGKEARTLSQKRIIAGILFHRLHIGMPLQVDVVFGFIFNKPTFVPSVKDLRVRSPYNTYIHKGLPPTPIDNPGSNSIFAVATAPQTPYLYYLTGKNGKMYYAKTLVGHQRNMRLFLR
ncbi:MAG TPA: endolytic transglycosylase MltG [Candidatus Kaiserbacteria bacterium]|nr:endolytic transglycosylase MltG [Candidatus Kaiserbacteria bacterium]